MPSKSLDEIFKSNDTVETSITNKKSLDDIFSESAQPNKSNTFDDFLSNSFGLGSTQALLGGGGALAAKGLQVLARPFYQSAQLSKQASPMRSTLGLDPNTSVSDIPAFINNKMGQFDIDLKGVSDNIAETLKKNYYGWKKSNYGNWSNEIDSITKEMEGKGLNFNVKNFNSMLEKSASYLESIGDVKGAEKLRSGIVETKKGGFLSKMIDFDQASSRISNLRESVPSASNVLRENWMDFLKNDPVMSQVPMTSERINTLYKNYVPFKNATNLIESLSPEKFGTLKTSQLSTFIQNAVKGNNADALRTLQNLSTGSSTISPMEGAGEALSSVTKLLSERSQLQSLVTKATEMALKQQGINRAINRRFMGLNVAGAGKLGGIAKAGLFGVYPAVGGVSGAMEMLQNKGTFPEQISNMTNNMFPGFFPVFREARPEDLQT
ncbi:MAG: hypothetical protein WC444_07240 [Candidatus Paceibacterota bacterium]